MQGQELHVDWIELPDEPETPPPRAPKVAPTPRSVREHRSPRWLPLRFSDALHGTLTGWSRDLSFTGIGIAASHVLPERTRLSLIVTLPEGNTRPMDGVVKWMRRGNPGLMGVQLDQMDRGLRSLVTAPSTRIAPGVFVPKSQALEEVPARSPLPLPREARLKRYRDELPLRIRTGNHVLRGFTFDLSPRGVGLRAASIPPCGTEVLVEITLPEGGMARVEGTVTWVSPPRRGEPMRGGVVAEYAGEEFFELVLDRQRAASAGMLGRP